LYAVQAVLPALADEWGLTESTASLAVSVATGALAISVLPWAAVADRIGRARAMIISAVVAATAGVLVPLAPSFEVLLVLRGISGLALGAVPALAMAHLVAQATPGRVSAIGGLYIAGTTIGGLTGRVLTGAIGGWAGWRWGLAITAVLVAVAALIFVVLIPRDVVRSSVVPHDREGGARWRLRLALGEKPCGCSTPRHSC
jgi:MFS family permease